MSSFITWNSMFTWRATKECFWFITTTSFWWQFNVIKCFRAFLNKYIFLSHYCYSPSSFFFAFPFHADTKQFLSHVLWYRIILFYFPFFCSNKWPAHRLSLFFRGVEYLYIYETTPYIIIYLYICMNFFLFVFWIHKKMHLCGCLPVGNGAQNEDKQSHVKQRMKRYSLKRGMLIVIIVFYWIFYLNFCRYTDE